MRRANTLVALRAIKPVAPAYTVAHNSPVVSPSFFSPLLDKGEEFFLGELRFDSFAQFPRDLKAPKPLTAFGLPFVPSL